MCKQTLWQIEIMLTNVINPNILKNYERDNIKIKSYNKC